MRQWPLFQLVVRTPRLTLRPVAEADMGDLMDLADRGVHDPSTMPFLIPWTDEALPRRHWRSAQFYWSAWANWSAEHWSLPMVVRTVDGTAVGAQDLAADTFASTGEARTGSWLGQAFQGRGLGTEMRHAVAHLAFDGLGARAITSGAFWDNEASIGVSRKLGYDTVGEGLENRRGVPDRCVEFRLDSARWHQVRRDDITIEGLDAARPMFEW